MVKKLKVKRWTLYTLNGCHLGYVAEGERPLTVFFQQRSDDVALMLQLSFPLRAQCIRIQFETALPYGRLHKYIHAY